MAKMLGVWMFVVNPDRSAQDILHLRTGGHIKLTSQELAKIAATDRLLNVRVKVMDSDTFDDDLVFTDESFFLGIRDTNPTPFVQDVIVPASNVINSEPSYESTAEIYCKLSARKGDLVSTNSSNTKEVNVKI
jgi:hypothetical protein